MTHFRSRRAVATVATVAFLILLAPGAVLGHAELDTVSPADKSTVEGTPQIKMTFTEALDPAKSSITLVGPSGAVIDGNSNVPSGGSGKEMDFVVNGELQSETYTIRWTTASAVDGDIARGTTTFTVVAASAPPPSPTSSVAASVEPSAAASASPTVAPSVAPSPSAPPTTPATSTSDAIIPIVVVLVVLVGLGIWLLRGRGRGRGPAAG